MEESVLIFLAAALYISYLLLPKKMFIKFMENKTTRVIECDNRLQAKLVYLAVERKKYIVCELYEPMVDDDICVTPYAKWITEKDKKK